ncbi:FecR domain-containing protein [Kangiella shandongensis]|uniref:FecR domain-containing protein n=1 Tax=Kangiella shandongensis TaxID=2763258 RepID=UPI001CBF144E|nr:FecR domain-containing protein [Kangiella shandongensis]
MKRIFSFLMACLAVFFLMAFLAPQSVAEDWLYTVRKGDTIWGLSHKYLKEPMRFKDIQQYNGVEYDRQIPPGVTLKFPMEYLKFAPAEVEVKTINGTAHYIRRGVKKPLALNVKLVLDDILLTAPDSSVALLFADGSELLLGENSELIFDVQTKWGETGMVDSRMRLMKGSAEGRVKTLIGPGAHFEVQTPSAVATVRGTAFRVRLDGADSNVVFNEVDEGTVGVQLHEDQKLVKQGFGLKTSASSPALEPRALLPAPTFVNAQSNYPGLPVTLTWQPIDGAKHYLVELFKDAAMTRLLDKSTVRQHQFTLSSVELGEYSVRVRAVDAEGLQGLNNSIRFTVTPVPMSPVTKTPPQQLLAGKAILMTWQPAEKALHYRWRLLESDAETVIKEKETSETSVRLVEGLAAGEYFWQVAAGNDNGFGRYSKPTRIRSVLPSPPVIEPVEKELESDQSLLLQWSEVPLAKQYHWQVSSSANFDSVVAEGHSLTTRAVLNSLPQRELYIRVAAVGPYNDERYSESLRLEVVEPDNGKTAFSLGSVLLFVLLL